MIKKSIALSLSIIACNIYAAGGTWLVSPLPDQVGAFLSEHKKIINDAIAQTNHENGTNYVFQEESYSPYLSLAFLAAGESSIKSVKDKFPGISDLIKKVTQNRAPINATENYQNLTLTLWDNFGPYTINGSPKNHYVNVVLMPHLNEKAADLANGLRNEITNAFKIPPRGEWTGHLTLGKVCDKDDSQIVKTSAFKETLKNLYLSKKTDTKITSLIIACVTLNASDKSSETFELTGAQSE